MHKTGSVIRCHSDRNTDSNYTAWFDRLSTFGCWTRLAAWSTLKKTKFRTPKWNRIFVPNVGDRWNANRQEEGIKICRASELASLSCTHESCSVADPDHDSCIGRNPNPSSSLNSLARFHTRWMYQLSVEIFSVRARKVTLHSVTFLIFVLEIGI